MPKVHYADRTFDIADSVTSSDRSLTLTTGPGSAIALEQLTARDESGPPRTVIVL